MRCTRAQWCCCCYDANWPTSTTPCLGVVRPNVIEQCSTTNATLFPCSHKLTRPLAPSLPRPPPPALCPPHHAAPRHRSVWVFPGDDSSAAVLLASHSAAGITLEPFIVVTGQEGAAMKAQAAGTTLVSDAADPDQQVRGAARAREGAASPMQACGLLNHFLSSPLSSLYAVVLLPCTTAPCFTIDIHTRQHAAIGLAKPDRQMCCVRRTALLPAPPRSRLALSAPSTVFHSPAGSRRARGDAAAAQPSWAAQLRAGANRPISGAACHPAAGQAAASLLPGQVVSGAWDTPQLGDWAALLGACCAGLVRVWRTCAKRAECCVVAHMPPLLLFTVYNSLYLHCIQFHFHFSLHNIGEWLSSSGG